MSINERIVAILGGKSLWPEIRTESAVAVHCVIDLGGLRIAWSICDIVLVHFVLSLLHWSIFVITAKLVSCSFRLSIDGILMAIN